MSTFAITDASELIGSVNYLLSNIDTGNAVGNITVPDGTLVANVSTGQIVPYNVPGGTTYSYLNQFVNLRYSNNAVGTDGFSTTPTNYNYFGIYNSATTTASTNPAAYQWQQVAGGFGTTKIIYYSAFGGRQVQWAAANVAPSSNFVASVANVAIDLDVVTTAAGTPGQRGPIAMAYVVTTADPNTASSSTLTAWWSAARDAVTPPIGTGLTPVTGDTGTFIYGAGVGTPSGTFEYNGSGWVSVIGQVISGSVLVANTTPGNAIVTSSITGNLIASNTITGNTIQASTITGNLIAANTITGNTIQVNTITGNLIAANTITATNILSNTITANQIAANTITATQISSAYIYAGNIVSFGAESGNTSSPGYWLQYNTGNARFGGNVSIGSNLSVAGLITTGSLIANTVNTTQLSVNSATTVLFQGGAGANTSYPVSYYNTVGNVNWPENTRGFAIPAVAIRPTTDGSLSGSSILITFNTGVQCDTDNEYNIVELWRTGANITFGNVFNSVTTAVANTSGVTTNNMYLTGTTAAGTVSVPYGSILGESTNNGNTWGFSASPNSQLSTQAVSSVQFGNSSSSIVIDRSSLNTITTSSNFGGGPSGSWTLTPTGQRFTSNKVLFTGNEIGNASIDNDIGITTGQSAFSMYYRPYNFTAPGPATQQKLTVPTNFFSDIYDMTAAYNQTGNTQVKNAVFVGTGGDVLTSQFQFHSSNAAVTNTALTLRLTPTDSNLYGVSADLSTAPPTAWIAVGEIGAIVRSVDNGVTWASISSPTQEYLRSVVGYGGDATKRFVAVGDSGTIIHSSDGGLTWSAGTVPLTTDAVIRDLKSVAFSPRGGTGNAGQWTAVGQGVIYKCDKTSTTWTIAYQEAATVVGGITRLVSIGSNNNVYDNTVPVAAQAIGNTVINNTFQDSNYNNTQTYQYYLVVGNMNSAAGLNARFPSLTLQEIKR